MKYLFSYEDLTEDYSVFLEAEDMELEDDFDTEAIEDYLEEGETVYENKKAGITAALRKKSRASGIPVGILRKVFARGMQAWNAGHRPGVAQHQWGMGRVNSFITGEGGARKSDADLWKRAKVALAKKRKGKK